MTATRWTGSATIALALAVLGCGGGGGRAADAGVDGVQGTSCGPTGKPVADACAIEVRGAFGVHCFSSFAAADTDPYYCGTGIGERVASCGAYQVIEVYNVEAYRYYYDGSGALVAISLSGGGANRSDATCLAGPANFDPRDSSCGPFRPVDTCAGTCHDGGASDVALTPPDAAPSGDAGSSREDGGVPCDATVDAACSQTLAPGEFGVHCVSWSAVGADTTYCGTTIWDEAAACVGYKIRRDLDVLAGYTYYYDAATGDLVAVIYGKADTSEGTCVAGPPTFD